MAVYGTAHGMSQKQEVLITWRLGDSKKRDRMIFMLNLE